MARAEGPGWPCSPQPSPPASSGASCPYLRAFASAAPCPQGLVGQVPSCHRAISSQVTASLLAWISTLACCSSITTALTFTLDSYVSACLSSPLECQLCEARNFVESRAWLPELRPWAETILALCLCISRTLPLDLWACFCCDPVLQGGTPLIRGRTGPRAPLLPLQVARGQSV